MYRASRLEALVSPLWALLDKSWPQNVLTPQTVIAAHAGMKQWLAGELARHVGTRGISANIEIVLPSTWLDRMARERLGERAVSLPRYQRQHLRWSLHALLEPGRLVPGVSDPRIAAYLQAEAAGGEGELARRRYQLADRLSQIYSQYLVYRPDWLRAWEGGQFSFATRVAGNGNLSALEAQLLGPLWRALVRQLGRHRGEVIEELRSVLEADAAPRPTLQVFGVSHLAPLELQVLRAYAQRGLVALYVPDPCREYWGGLKHADTWQQYRNDESARIASAGDGDYWQEQTHPLLARWGRMGQHFFSALAEGEISEDVRHWQDQQAVAPVNRLQRVQESIRQLQPALMSVDIADGIDLQRERDDASLRVHACHTRLRELEVLRDVLLAAVKDGVAPGDMVVMTPNIRAYLPLIPAVFGEPGSARERLLPYHLADVPVSCSHPLFGTVRQLLQLPGLRITGPEVVDLLSLAQLQQRMGLDEGDVETLGEWLRNSRVAWALDGKHRGRFGVPPIAEHTFAWAMDRMIAGYLMSDAAESDREQALRLPDGTGMVPVGGIHGPSADALGALDRVLQELQAWTELGSKILPASEWATLLERRLEALFRIDPMDRDAREAWNGLKKFVRQLETEPEGAEENPLLHFAVVRDLLSDRLDSVPERQRFLMGGVTFCGMVPQRAIPFRMVAVLGLDDGEFPRIGSDGGLDLMLRIRRIGDRDVRSDDRYLFLETLMATRDRLHLSFLGENVKDGKPRNPAAPLAELMAELDQATRPGGEQKDTRPWLVKHPLQPFDARYFDGSDSRLFSFSERFASMHGSGEGDLGAFLAPGAEGRADPLPVTLSISEVVAYYRNPAEYLLKRRLKLRLDALEEDRLPEVEPLDTRTDRIDTVARRVFFRDVLPNWPDGAWQPEQAPAWVRLTGLLAPGRMGEQAWQDELAAVNDLLLALRSANCMDAEAAAQARQLGIDLQLEDGDGDGAAIRLTGKAANVFALCGDEGPGLQLIRAFPNPAEKAKTKPKLKQERDLGFGDRVAMFVEWAALRLQSVGAGDAMQPVRLTVLLGGDGQPWLQSINDWDRALLAANPTQRAAMLRDLESRLARLVRWWREAQAQPRWYFNKTSWAAATRDSTGDFSSIAAAWAGSEHSPGERDYEPGYSRMLAGDVGFDADGEDMRLLLEFAEGLYDCIRLPTTVLEIPA